MMKFLMIGYDTFQANVFGWQGNGGSGEVAVPVE